MCVTTTDWFTSGSVSFELIKGLPAVLITLGLGILALRIQKNQAKVATAKLKLDLFERRIKIFEATKGALDNVMKDNAIANVEATFLALIPQARFLFGSDIEDYLKQVVRRSVRYELLRRKFSDQLETKLQGRTPTPADAKLFADNPEFKDLDELRDWFLSHAIHECNRQFGRYLAFSEWR